MSAWIEDVAETTEIGLEADELKVGNKNAIFHWIWQEQRCVAALLSCDVWRRDVLAVMKKVRQRITDFNVTLSADEAHQQLDQELQFLKHRVELLAKAEIEGWNEHFGEGVFHQINQCLLRIEKALCEVSASRVFKFRDEDDEDHRSKVVAEARSEIGARCRQKVRDIMLLSELSDEACLRIDDFCQKRWQRNMAENGGGLFDFWDWNKETAEERQRWNEVMKDYAAYLRAKG
mgnify:CR=1 FL=1